MTNQPTPRRDFIKLTAASAIAWDAASYAKISGANDRIGIGFVGFGERAQEALLPALLQHATAQNCEVAAICDLWRLRREAGAAAMNKATNQAVALARNTDELYAMKNVDAVIIATADFQHALHGVEAVRAGRDAYIEKPLANTMDDARAILKAVNETKRIVQIGTQRRSTPNYQRAKEFIQSGEFGDLVMAEFTRNHCQPKRFRRPDWVALLKEADTDWRRWLLNRPPVPFDARKYVEFRWYWPYSSGLPCQYMVHQIDALHFTTGLTRPRSVVATGGIYQWRDGRTNGDTVTVIAEYGHQAKSFQAMFMSRLTNSAGRGRDIYRSHLGTLDAGTCKVTREGGLEERYASKDYKASALAERTLLELKQGETLDVVGEGEAAVSAHMLNWLECLRSRQQPAADVRAGYDHSVALCMMIAAMQSGRRATFDEAKQEIRLA